MKDNEKQSDIQSFLEKLEEMDIEALRFKVKYVNCIDDTLQKPIEVWLHPETNTVHYFKLYEGEVTIIVKVIDSVFEDFEVIKDNFEYVDSLRRGVLIYPQK